MKSLSLTIVLLLTLFNRNSMDEKQIKAYNALYEKMEKWATYINEQEAYAADIPGFFDAALLAQKTRVKSDLAAIRKRIEKIAVAKNFTLETLQVQEEEVLVAETTTTENPEKEVEYAMGTKGGPSGDVIVTLPNLEEEIADVGKGEFVRVLVTWCNQVIKNLNQLKSKLGTTSVTNDGKEALILDFSSTIPAINEIKTTLDVNLFTCQTIGEVCDLLLTELDNYNSTEKAEAHYRKYKSIYTADNPNGNYEISPSPNQIKTTLEDATDKETPNYPKDPERIAGKIDTIQLYIQSWHTDVGKAIDREMKTHKISKDTKISGTAFQEAVENIFKGTISPVNELGVFLTKPFNYQIQLTSDEAETILLAAIDKSSRNYVWLNKFIDAGIEEPNFPSAESIGRAFANSKIGAGGDAIAADSFKTIFEDWRKDAVALLTPLQNDSTMALDDRNLAVISKNIGKRQNPAFEDFFNSLESIIGRAGSETAAQTKADLQEKLLNLQTDRIYETWKDNLPKSFPNLKPLAFYIDENRIDTSFQHYLDQWEDWRKANFIENVGILPNESYFTYPILGQLRNYFRENLYGSPIAEFIPKKWEEMIGPDDGLVKGSKLIEMWKLLIALSPTRKDYNNILRLDAQEMYSFISTYTQLLPTSGDFVEIIGQAKQKKSGTSSPSINNIGLLELAFDFEGMDAGLLPLKRSLGFLGKSQMQQMGNALCIKKLSFEHHIWLGVTASKIPTVTIGNAEIKGKELINGVETITELFQTIDVQLIVDSFGDNSRQISGGVAFYAQAQAASTDGTTIGGGVYSFRLHLKSKWVDGKIQVKLESGSKTRPGESLPWLKVAENSSILNSRSY